MSIRLKLQGGGVKQRREAEVIQCRQNTNYSGVSAITLGS